jgi:hypothetical protein
MTLTIETLFLPPRFSLVIVAGLGTGQESGLATVPHPDGIWSQG